MVSHYYFPFKNALNVQKSIKNVYSSVRYVQKGLLRSQMKDYAKNACHRSVSGQNRVKKFKVSITCIQGIRPFDNHLLLWFEPCLWQATPVNYFSLDAFR